LELFPDFSLRKAPRKKSPRKKRPLSGEAARIAQRKIDDLKQMSFAVCQPDPGPIPDADLAGFTSYASDGTVTVRPKP
jgi:hypothetical protein